MGTKQHGPDWWPGGHIRRGKRRDVYVIERRVGGTHFHVSTRASTLGAAMKHLERFEANPDTYRPSEGTVAVAMTAALVLEYQDWQLDVKRVSRPWAADCARLLAQWSTDLRGKDLRQLNLQKDIKPALAKRQTTQHHRAIALKGFFKWLRREKGLLKHSEDVTLDLAIPKVRASKLTKPKNVELELVKAVAAHLQPHIRDVLVVQMGTGWHISEVRKFALRGEIVEANRHGVLAVLVTEHKTKRLTRMPIKTAEHLDAARRIRARGKIVSNNTLNYHLKRAAKAASIEKGFTLGSMRHSVSTWAIESGARMAEIAEFFEHRSPNTTADHYANASVPTVSIPVHTLH